MKVKLVVAPDGTPEGHWDLTFEGDDDALLLDGEQVLISETVALTVARLHDENIDTDGYSFDAYDGVGVGQIGIDPGPTAKKNLDRLLDIVKESEQTVRRRAMERYGIGCFRDPR